jgi:hypothetical protein
MIRVHRPPAIPAPLTTHGHQLRSTDVAHHAAGGSSFTFNRTVYGHPDVKDALRLAQHDKCGFCESKVSHVAFGDVEHFRPKAGYRSASGAPLTNPGYFWLAYDWNNLLFACEPCNRRHKGSLFPLVDEAVRARGPSDDITREAPLFIDPSTEDPSLYVGFRQEFAYAVGGSARGRETILALGLDRAELVERRRDRLSKLRLMDAAAAELRRKRGPGARKVVQQIEAELAHSVTDGAEFAAMARRLVRRTQPKRARRAARRKRRT